MNVKMELLEDVATQSINWKKKFHLLSSVIADTNNRMALDAASPRTEHVLHREMNLPSI
jgi:hypothetical protein